MSYLFLRMALVMGQVSCIGVTTHFFFHDQSILTDFLNRNHCYRTVCRNRTDEHSYPAFHQILLIKDAEHIVHFVSTDFLIRNHVYSTACSHRTSSLSRQSCSISSRPTSHRIHFSSIENILTDFLNRHRIFEQHAAIKQLAFVSYMDHFWPTSGHDLLSRIENIMFTFLRLTSLIGMTLSNSMQQRDQFSFRLSIEPPTNISAALPPVVLRGAKTCQNSVPSR
ncbi:hypothetical protein BCR34DRAFT_367407 [Clohesyomyces aquaticus]|uniref:Secreted protein n=1 Tax=Clohesyomyces aquaticus TaxID=1231657 RepID=A0A1Y1ZIM0_9PLEO|nr:hypothetical protein BCR34DRAFT_367407 [Clohesyomyces aquaticus]